jgi:hypothetical protein
VILCDLTCRWLCLRIASQLDRAARTAGWRGAVLADGKPLRGELAVPVGLGFERCVGDHRAAGINCELDERLLAG